MEWTTCLREAINYIDAHLSENISPEDIAQRVFMSPFYLQKGFKIMTGYSIGEYIRYRKLYLAAIDTISGNEKIIDLAYKYGYDTPESFTRAFGRFHGVSPVQMRNHPEKIKTFLPLKIKISIQGGHDMDYVVEKMRGFQIIGFGKEFKLNSAYQEIPQFWAKYRDKYCNPSTSSQVLTAEEIKKVVCDCHVGEFGISIDDSETKGYFRYLIAGTYRGQSVPEGMTLYTFPDMEWVKFNCTGPMPGALQSVNTKIFQEWLPDNPDYEIALGVNIEWYAKGDILAPDYESAIWLPVRKK